MRDMTFAAIATIGLILPGTAWSQDAVNLMHKEPTQQEIIDALTPAPVQKTRGIKPVSREEEAKPAGVDLAVQFELNSSVLTEDAKTRLSTLAGALKSNDLRTFNFMVEGHTDATGTDEYNMSLSQRRAKAVVDFLALQHGINPSQLSPVGKGEAELLDVNNPASGINRRVRIRNLDAG